MIPRYMVGDAPSASAQIVDHGVQYWRNLAETLERAGDRLECKGDVLVSPRLVALRDKTVKAHRAAAQAARELADCLAEVIETTEG